MEDDFNKLIINDYEYDYLTGQWEGPLGAAYNSCMEFCRENGFVTYSGEVTPAGRRQIELFDILGKVI